MVRGRRSIVQFRSLFGRRNLHKIKVEGGTRQAAKKIAADPWFVKRLKGRGLR